jgi:hypothetical protein
MLKKGVFKMKKSYLFILCMLTFSVFYTQNSIHILAKSGYLLPDNKEKQFISARDFFESGNLKENAQFKEAKINLQEKLLYKDLKKFIKLNVNEYYYINLFNIYSNQNNNVSPNRQVYFYCSIMENDKTLNYKYIIVDAETKDPIESGRRQAFKHRD